MDSVFLQLELNPGCLFVFFIGNFVFLYLLSKIGDRFIYLFGCYFISFRGSHGGEFAEWALRGL